MPQQVVEKICLQAGQKDLRGEASTLAQPDGARLKLSYQPSALSILLSAYCLLLSVDP